MSLALVSPPLDPLKERVSRDGLKAVASAMVAAGLRGSSEWGPVYRAVYDLPMNDPETVQLQRIVYEADGRGELQPALLAYIQFLHATHGLTACALTFAELAYDLADGRASGDLLIEIGTLNRKLCRWHEAEQAWKELDDLGRRVGRDEWTFRAAIGRGMVARHLGNLAGARTYFESVSIGAYHYPELRAMALNNLGTVLDHMHPPQHVEAAIAFWDAFYLYTDPRLKYSAMMNAGISAKGSDHWVLADKIFRLVYHLSPCWADQTNCLIERLDTCSALHDMEQLRHVRTLLRFRFNKFTPDFRVDYEYRCGLIELRQGRSPAPNWQAALWHANKHRLGEWAIRLEKLLEVPMAELKRMQVVEPVEVPRLQPMLLDAELQCATAGV